MNIGLLLPGFSSNDDDWAIPVQQHLVAQLAQADRVRVVALRYPHQRTAYQLAGARVYPLGAGQGRGLRRLALWSRALRLLRRLHREQPFDVLHAMWADETGLLAVWAGRLLGVPSVVSVLGGELTRLDDIAYGLQRGAFSRWIVGQALHANAIIGAGAYLREALNRAHYHVPSHRLHLLPLGVDVERFTPAHQPPEPNRLLHVGSLVLVKDQATLLRALARLPRRVTLDIVGEGPERPRLTALAASLGLIERVRFLGAVPYPDLPDCYRRSALHVMASRSEALPIAVLEAAACGLHTVCTAAGALPDYPALATTVPAGDDAALAAGIARLLDDSQQLAMMGAAARTAVEKEFTIERAALRFHTLYRQISW